MLQKICCLTTDSCKGSCLGFTKNQNVKVGYIVIFLLLLLVSHFKNSLNRSQGIDVSEVKKYNCDQLKVNYQNDCVMQKKITLDFMSLSFFHLILLALMIPKTKHVKIINEGLWIFKIVFLVGLTALVDLTFGPGVSDWAQFIATWVSPALYIIMNIITVDNIYFIDFKLNQKTQKHRQLHVVKVVFSVLFWMLAILCNVFSYYYNQLWVSIGNSVLIGLFLVLLFLRVSKNNTLFVYALICLHANLIAYSIHQQDENSQQEKKLGLVEHGYRIFMVIVILLGMLTEGGNQIRTKRSTINQMLALNTTKKQEDNRYVSSNKWLIYHYAMALIALAFPVVFCYEHHSMNEFSGQFLDIGRITWWSSLPLIYLWSIIAQKIYPQQDLSQLQNYFKEFQLN